MRAIPPIIVEPTFAFLFFLVVVALGYRIARVLRIPLHAFTLWERALLCSALGAGFAQYLPFALGSLGELSAVSVRWAVGVLSVLLIPDLLRAGRRLKTAVLELMAVRPSLALTIWLSVLLLFAGTLCVRAVVVDVGGDDDGYHLTAPKRWLEAGSLSYLPTYSHTNAPMGFEMLYAIGLVTGGIGGAKFLHFGAGILCLAGVFLASRRLGNTSVGVLATTLLIIPNPAWDVPFLFGMAYNDLAVCWMTITSLLLFLIWREHPDNRILVAAALCAGFAGSYKFTALSVGIALALVVLSEALHRNLKWRQATALAAMCGGVSVAPVLPWLWRNWVVTSNPFYPMFSSIIPTRDWNAEQARVFGLFFRYYNWAKASGSRLSLAQRQELLLVVGVGVLLALIVAIVRTRQRALQELVGFATVVLTVALVLTGLYFRFWLPAVTCLVVFVACRSADRWSEHTLVTAAVILLVAGLGLRIRTESARLPGDLRMATGLSSRDQEYKNDPFWNTWSYINANTPPDAHVLIAAFYTTFGSSSGGAFWIQRPCYVTDSHIQAAIRLSDWSAFLTSIEGAGIDYVVIADQQFAVGRHGFSFEAATNEYPFCQRLVREYGTLVNTYGHLQVYRLRHAPNLAALPGRSPFA